MEKCFRFAIHLYDKKEKRYYGEGKLVAGKEQIDGYICNDLLSLIPNGDDCGIVFVEEEGITINTTIHDMFLTFPGKYNMVLEKGKYAKCELEVKEKISDPKECNKVLEEIERIKSTMYRE